MIASYLTYGIVASALLAFLFFPLGIKFAYRLKILDYPSARKRHTKPTPIIGGICIFSAWTIGMLFFYSLNPTIYSSQIKSFFITTGSIWTLIGLGLWDDIKGISPRTKLIVQFIIAGATVQLEPNLHAICMEKGSGMSNELYLIFIFTPAVIWLVGIMNAINLIDGIDGFAGGASLLISIAILALNFFPGSGNNFGILTLSLLLLPLITFLKFNWFPAKAFLGDNGSFPLGYLLAFNMLIHRSNPNLLVAIPCLFIVFAYPIIDMGLCVFRRFYSGYPLFKADRNHLHHRIQRMGLSVSQTTGFLLCIVAYSEITAIFINSVHPLLVITTITSFALSMFIFLYLIRAMEKWRATNIANPILHSPLQQEELINNKMDNNFICIDLRPLLEVGAFEEKNIIQPLITSLNVMLSRNISPDDKIISSGHFIYISSKLNRDESYKIFFLKKIKEDLLKFQTLYSLQYSIAGLPAYLVNEIKEPTTHYIIQKHAA